MKIPPANCEFRTQTAYHEAGHAVALWLFGRGHDIHFISMRGSDRHHAFVRQAAFNIERLRVEFWNQPDYVASVAKIEIFNCLAGPTVEHMIQQNEGWLLDELDYHWSAPEESPGSDIERAIALAAVVTGGEWSGRSFRLLDNYRQWIWEAYHDPRVWAVIHTLADRLEHQNRMSGVVANRLMSDAAEWAGRSAIPILKVSPHWRRRTPSVSAARIRDCILGQ